MGFGENRILGKCEFGKRGFWLKIFGKKGILEKGDFLAKGILGKKGFWDNWI